jgi:hypothetical protein
MMFNLFVPYRIAAGSAKPTKTSAMTSLLAETLAYPVILLPLLLPAALGMLWGVLGGPAAVPVRLLASVALAGVSAAAYAFTLEPLGRLLQAREQKILQVVTQEME